MKFFSNRPFPVFSFAGIASGLAVLLIFTAKPVNKMHRPYRLLCLGDSYTIGESVSPNENFPRQAVQLLCTRGYDFDDPEIVAQTGWTTYELQNAINTHTFNKPYDFVTLLIGVNNQYRGIAASDYKPQFESLLKQAVQYAGGNPNHTIVLSIPDWGVTPYAKNSGRDRVQVGREIDTYNEINKTVAANFQVKYIDITGETRKAAGDPGLLASDGLHPSAREYTLWADKVANMVELELH